MKEAVPLPRSSKPRSVEAYPSKAPTRTEFEQIGQDVVEDLKANGVELSMLELGHLMKPVAVKIARRFNGKTVSDIVRA